MLYKKVMDGLTVHLNLMKAFDKVSHKTTIMKDRKNGWSPGTLIKMDGRLPEGQRQGRSLGTKRPLGVKYTVAFCRVRRWHQSCLQYKSMLWLKE